MNPSLESAPPSSSPAPSVPAPSEPAPSAPAPSEPAPSAPADRAKRTTLSLALERVGGVAYANLSSGDSDASLSLFSAGVGGASATTFTTPRVGFDGIMSSGFTVGAAIGFSYYTASVGDGANREGLGSVSLYTFAPRVGYRVRLSDRVDLTPRAALTLLGGSVSYEEDDRSSSFGLAIGAEAPFAFRATDSLNLLVGPGFDYTVANTASSRSGSSSSSDAVDGKLLSIHAWLGLGGYL